MSEPAITVSAIHTSGPLAMPVTRIVIHATCPNVGYPQASAPGSARGTALYFQSPASGGSAHYVEAVDGEEHCVPDNVEAWHAPPNPHSIGIEICGEGGNYSNSYSRAQWLSPQVWPGVLRAAARCAELCDRFGVPKVKIGPGDLLAGARGVCGHVDVSNAWHQSDHSDPGPEFPWTEFMAAVNKEDDMQADERQWLWEVHNWIRGNDPNVDNITLLWMQNKSTLASFQTALAKLEDIRTALLGGNVDGKNNFHWLDAQDSARAAQLKADLDGVHADLLKLLPH